MSRKNFLTAVGTLGVLLLAANAFAQTVSFGWRAGDSAELTYEKTRRGGASISATSLLVVKDSSDSGRLSIELSEFKLQTPSLPASKTQAPTVTPQEVLSLVLPNFSVNRDGGEFRVTDRASHLMNATRILEATAKATGLTQDAKTVLQNFSGQSFDNLMLALAEGTWNLWVAEWQSLDLQKLPVQTNSTVELMGQSVPVDVLLEATKLDIPNRWRISVTTKPTDSSLFGRLLLARIEQTIGGTEKGRAEIDKLRKEFSLGSPEWTRRITVDLASDVARPYSAEMEDTIKGIENGKPNTERQLTRYKFSWRDGTAR